MRFRFAKRDEGQSDEARLTEDLRALLRARGRTAEPRLPADTRARLLAATHARLDAATSTGALSWSWAARVAIPGVVAIIAFFTAVHYYRSPVPVTEPAFLPVLADLPGDALDSLLAVRGQNGPAEAAADAAHLFDVPREAAEEYLLNLSRTPVVLETLSEEEVTALETELRRSASPVL